MPPSSDASEKGGRNGLCSTCKKKTDDALPLKKNLFFLPFSDASEEQSATDYALAVKKKSGKKSGNSCPQRGQILNMYKTI